MTTPATNPRQRKALLVLAFIASAFVIHALALSNPFLIDDHSAIEQHPDVQQVGGVLRLWTHHYWQGSPSLDDQLYRPITVFSFWLSQHITPDSATGFRIVNILLLAGIALCVFSWVRRYAGSCMPAAFAGALVLAHPANTEAINHIIGRADLLAAFGIVGFLATHAKAQHLGWTAPRIALAAACALIALGSKESGLALIPCAIAQAWAGKSFTSTQTKSQAHRLTAPGHAAGTGPNTPELAQADSPKTSCYNALGICPKRALFLSLFLPAALYLIARLLIVGLPTGYAPTTDDLTGNPLRGMGFLERLPDVAAVAGWYVKQLVWPSTTYNHTPIAANIENWTALSVVGIMVYAGLVAAVVALSRKRLVMLVAIVLLLAHLLIVGHLLSVTGAYAANRLTIPMTTASAMVLALLLAPLIQRSAMHRNIITACALLIALTFAFLTANANRAWSSELSRMHADVQANDEDPIALYWLSQAQLDIAPDAAISHLKRAQALAPQSNQVSIQLAGILFDRGENNAAWKLYDVLLQRSAPLNNRQRDNAARTAYNTQRNQRARDIHRTLPNDLANKLTEELAQQQHRLQNE